jgi:iron complex outermembrane receptor protein
VPGIPKQKLSIELTYKFLFGLNTAFSFNLIDRIYVNDWNGPPPNTTGNNSDYYNNGFFTTDLMFVYDLFTGFGNVGFFGGINNLFNIRYNSSVVPNAAANRYFEPGAPRNWYGGLSVKFF